MGKMHKAMEKAANSAPRAPSSEVSPGTGSVVTTTALTMGRGGDVDPHLVALLDPRSPLSEQYRTLRTNILAAETEPAVSSVVITSAVPGEGKSVTSVNLACMMAEEVERKVVLVDADLRKPSIHKLLGIDNQRGLSDYLSGGTMLEMIVQRCRLPNLWVMSAGSVPANPAELLGSKRMDDLLSRLRRDYDFVVIDTPPIISTTDPGVLSPRVDGTLLVVRMDSTPRDVSKHAVAQLKKARANVLGLVLTGLSGDVKDYYYYPYDEQG